MEKKLKLSPELSLPTDVATQKINVLGQSGGGKTYLAMKLAELMLELPVLICSIDLVGVWPGLLSSADGLHPGFPVLVIGGEKGHLPLNPEAGRLTADMVYDQDVSVVLDVSDLLAEDEEQLVVFLADFLEQLFLRHKKGKKRRHIFYEEAQEIFPEQMSLKGHVRLRRVGTRLCKIGRNYGLGYTTITQEPQSTSKRILNQAGTLIAVRTIGELERKAIAGTARSAATEGLDLMNVLPELQTGEAMVWSPAWLRYAGKVHVLPKVTFDSSKTPDGDDDTVQPKVLAPVEVEQLRLAMASAIAKVEAENPEALKRRIRKLEVELAAKPAAPPQVVEVPLFNEQQRAALVEVEHQVLELNRTLRDLIAVAQEVGAMGARARVSTQGGTQLNVPATWAAAIAVPKKVTAVAPKLEESTEVDDDDADANTGTLLDVLATLGGSSSIARLALFAGMSSAGGGFRRQLKGLREGGLVVVEGDVVRLGAGMSSTKTVDPAAAIATWKAKLGPAWVLVDALNVAGSRPPSKVAAELGQSAKGGGFRRSLKRLRKAGFVEVSGADVELTPAARELLGSYRTEARTHEQIVGAWNAKLGDGPRQLLGTLVRLAPAGLTPGELAGEVGMSAAGGGFRRNLKKLRTLGLAVENQAGITASPSLWP